MEYKKIASKGVVQGVGTALVFVLIKKLDKNLVSTITIKSALVLIASVALANLGIEYAEEKGYSLS